MGVVSGSWGLHKTDDSDHGFITILTPSSGQPSVSVGTFLFIEILVVDRRTLKFTSYPILDLLVSRSGISVPISE
jgi:hypothetical protein